MTIRNVKTFGAKCDGLTDDTDAIQAAIDACDEGDAVRIPRGVCRVTRTLILREKGK